MLALLQDTGPCRPPQWRGGQGGATGHHGIQVREGLRGVTGTSGSLISSDDFTAALAHPLLQRPAERRGGFVFG